MVLFTAHVFFFSFLNIIYKVKQATTRYRCVYPAVVSHTYWNACELDIFTGSLRTRT